MQAPDLDKKTLEEALEFERIGNRAVRKAQERNRRLGVPNVYSINGTIYYERPDGTLSTDRSVPARQALNWNVATWYGCNQARICHLSTARGLL
jgi:hypothetical protein